MNKMPENARNDLPSDAAIEARTRAIFRSACDGTDSYHALRLGLARRKALNARDRNPALRIWAPLVGAAACCVLVAGVAWMHPLARTTTTQATRVVSSAPIVTNQNDEDEALPEVGSTQMEVVQNLDFYRWLATQPSVASASGGSEH